MIFHLVVLPTVLLHIPYAGCRVLVPLFALSFGVSPFTVGIIMSLLGLLPMMFAIGAGRVIDRIGARTPMMAGTCIVIAGLLAGVALPRLEILFLVTPLVGAGFIVFFIAANHAAGALGGPEKRSRNFSLMALAFSTSGFLGPLLTGFAIDWIGYRYTFLLLAGSAAGALLVVLMTMPGTPQHEPAETGGKRRRFTDLLQDPVMRRVFIISGSLSVAWDLFSFMAPVHGSQIGLSASQIGLILGCFGVAVFFVRLILPWCAQRVSEWRMMTTAMFTAGVVFFVFPLTHMVPLLMVFAFILGAGLGGAQPMIMTLLYAHAPAGRGGEAVGMRTVLINLSQTGMPLLFGALGAAFGMTPVFWAVTALLLACGYRLRKP